MHIYVEKGDDSHIAIHQSNYPTGKFACIGCCFRPAEPSMFGEEVHMDHAGMSTLEKVIGHIYKHIKVGHIVPDGLIDVFYAMMRIRDGEADDDEWGRL